MNIRSQFQAWAFVLPLIAVIIWSLNIVVTRFVVDYISPMSISFYRWFIAFIVLTPFLLRSIWRLRVQVKQNAFHLAVLSAFGMFLYQGLSYNAAQYTTATNMGIINAFIPVFTILVSVFILKDLPNRYAVVGSFVSFSALLYVIGQGNFNNLLNIGHHWGDFMMIIAVFFYAFYGVFLKKWRIDMPLMVSLYVQVVFVVIYHLPFILWQGLDPLDVHNIGSVLYAGIFPSIIAPLVWMMAVQLLGPNRTSIFMNLMPIITALIAYVWLKETWTLYHSIGGVMILLGIALSQKKLID